MDEDSGTARRPHRACRIALVVALGVIGLIALVPLTAVCACWGNPGCLNGDEIVEAPDLTDARIISYDGETLTLQVELLNEMSGRFPNHVNSININYGCVEVEGHNRPCYADTSGIDDHEERARIRRQVSDARYEAQALRFTGGSYSFRYRQTQKEAVDDAFWPPTHPAHLEDPLAWPPRPSIHWSCRVQGFELEGCTGRYSQQEQDDPPGWKRPPEPLERQHLNFDFTNYTSRENGDRASIRPGDAVTMHLEFQIPGLEQGDEIAIHWQARSKSLELGADQSG